MSRSEMDHMTFCIRVAAIVIWQGLLTTAILAQTNQQPARQRPTNSAATPGDAKTTQSKSVVAVVNGQSISRQELAQQCLKRYGETVLESLVNKHLILQACQQRSIRITREDIEREISRICAASASRKTAGWKCCNRNEISHPNSIDETSSGPRWRSGSWRPTS